VTDSANAQRLELLAQELDRTLETEFAALQGQDLDRFEQLQPGKTELLAELSRLCPPAEELQSDPAWAALRDSLTASRDKHRRNSILITRKLEAVRGALSSLSTEQPGSSVEVYDRLGQLARFHRGRGYHDA
jgi:flagellar biosynthesis/type III secretory pathway chaperone